VADDRFADGFCLGLWGGVGEEEGVGGEGAVEFEREVGCVEKSRGGA
jgi:hypothetical protein